MLVANYATGTLGALPIKADGSLAPLATKIAIPRQPGPHKTPQKGIQPHQIPYDPTGRFLVVPDKGGDKVSVFRFDAEKVAFLPNEPASVKAREGAGCRHIAFHPSKPPMRALSGVPNRNPLQRASARAKPGCSVAMASSIAASSS